MQKRESDPADMLLERDGQIAWITFRRDDLFNAFDAAAFGFLADLLEEVGHDPSVGVVVLTGEGDRAFCSGGYLGDLANFSRDEARRLYDSAQRCMQIMRRIPQPIIAAVNGYAIGSGNEIVICSDLAIAAAHAKFGQTGPRIGSSPIFGATNMLALTIGEKRAREVCYLCRTYSAEEALSLGWINKVVPQEELRAEVRTWCEEILDKSPAYIETTKIASNLWWDMSAGNMELAKQMLLRLAGGEEMREGASAFMEKRKPDFRRFRR